MRDHFRGWTSVLGFTFQQSLRSKGFKFSTGIVAILLIVAIVIINILAAKPEKTQNELNISPIQTVYVLDDSGLPPTDYKAISPQLSDVSFNHIEFISVSNQSREEVITTASHSSTAIAIIITKNGSKYQMESIIPKGSVITLSQTEALLQPLKYGFEMNKLLQSGLTDEQLQTITKPIITSFSSIGDSKNELTVIIQLVAPMVFGLMLYMMLLLHGQSVSKSVSTEKTSKLVETLLTSIHPYAMISGKVLAVTSIALLQFTIWIISALVGLYSGNAIARLIYPNYDNTVITIINHLRDNLGDTALTIPALIMAIVFFCVGFLFYCVLAALAGSMVSKPEDVASTQMIFQIPVIISWLVTYLAPLMHKDTVISVAQYIPLTSPFSAPVNLITGSMGLLEGFISLMILLIFSLLIIVLSAKIYKGLILYTGQKLNIKNIGSILKNNK